METRTRLFEAFTAGSLITAGSWLWFSGLIGPGLLIVGCLLGTFSVAMNVNLQNLFAQKTRLTRIPIAVRRNSNLTRMGN